MGIFDIFKPKAQNRKYPENNKSAKAIRDDFEHTKMQVERIQADNATWIKEFNTIKNYTALAFSLERDGKLYEAIEVYLKSVQFGEASLWLNSNNYAHDIDRLIVLYNKTKQNPILTDFLEHLILKYPDYRGAQKWAVRLSSIKNIKYQIEIVKINDIKKPLPNKPTLGDNFQNYLRTFPKFNFYCDMPDGMNTFKYLSCKKPVHFEMLEEMRTLKVF